MKRMTTVIIITAAGIGICGVLVLVHACRTAPEVPAVSDLPPPARRAVQPVDAWQGGIKVDARTDYHANPEATKHLMEKLRQEELRQKPWEGRN